MRESRNSFRNKEESGLRKAQRKKKTRGECSSSQDAEDSASDATLYEIKSLQA